MTYDPELWRMPDDRIWALREAAKPGGMMPNAASVRGALDNLEKEMRYIPKGLPTRDSGSDDGGNCRSSFG